MVSILFHHSNVRLPLEVERKLNRVFVTPRMHGIHHSTVKEETNSNWSSGLTIWDRLHGTFRGDVPQDTVDTLEAGKEQPTLDDAQAFVQNLEDRVAEQRGEDATSPSASSTTTSTPSTTARDTTTSSTAAP